MNGAGELVVVAFEEVDLEVLDLVVEAADGDGGVGVAVGGSGGGAVEVLVEVWGTGATVVAETGACWLCDTTATLGVADTSDAAIVLVPITSD